MSITDKDRQTLIDIRNRYINMVNSSRRGKLFDAINTITNIIDGISNEDIVEIESKMGASRTEYHRRGRSRSRDRNRYNYGSGGGYGYYDS